jgi:hypothetical protein
VAQALEADMIRYDIADRVAHVRLNRPNEPNCVSLVRSPQGRHHPGERGIATATVACPTVKMVP